MQLEKPHKRVVVSPLPPLVGRDDDANVPENKTPFLVSFTHLSFKNRPSGDERAASRKRLIPAGAPQDNLLSHSS